MGRAPCCEKMGLKKGPWTPDEDQILVSYILQHGHSNWRALPKHAGLLRCGKSCRLRWVNYLNPDIKRGGFTLEEEESIIKLHEMLGNRWSAIAARLPGRTDNEIKNVWHTHLKKRLSDAETSNKEKNKMKKIKSIKAKPSNNQENNSKMSEETDYFPAGSPQQSITTTTTTTDEASFLTEDSSMQSFPEIDESFWTENLSTDDFEIAYSMTDNVDQVANSPPGFQDAVGGGVDHEMDFWYNVLIQTGGPQELEQLNFRI